MKLLEYVNIKHGTDSQMRFSNGNTLPLVSLPHALASFSLQTCGSRGGWFYHPRDCSFEGIRLTHRPSPWIGDFSWFSFMPQSGGVFVSEDMRWSGFRTDKTILRPDCVRAHLLRYNASVSLAPTDTGAVMRLEYFGNDVPRFAVTPSDFDGEIHIDVTRREIRGYTTSNNGKPERKMPIYFIFAFDCDIYDCFVTDGSGAMQGTHFSGNAAGANVALKSRDVQAKLAVSYISYEQARVNLTRDASADYETTRETAEQTWENALSAVMAEGDESRKRTFYSCLYRAYLYPTKFHERTDDGRLVHIEPESGRICEGVMYTNNGFWDTFRTVYPLYSLIIPEKCRDMAEGWLNFFDDTGYLPRWPSPCEENCMPGTLVEAVLADAVVKGLLDSDMTNRALKAMLKNAEIPSDTVMRGRKCVSDYISKGYVPYDKCRESVNETLDCAYGDYCISRVAECAGDDKTAEIYRKRSKNYVNLFDGTRKFMIGRNSDGSFRDEFSPIRWGGDYTEACAWQSTLNVQHDVDGLAMLFGGSERLEKYVDALLSEPPCFEVGEYGHEIHEMTEMAVSDFGQCAMSNQPSFHIPFIYAALGKKEKSSALVRRIADELFSAADDGFPGDEDNGTMASWYVFAAIGLYPFCPADGRYIVTEPLFDRVLLRTKEGYKDITAIGVGKKYVAHADVVR